MFVTDKHTLTHIDPQSSTYIHTHTHPCTHTVTQINTHSLTPLRSDQLQLTHLAWSQHNLTLIKMCFTFIDISVYKIFTAFTATHSHVWPTISYSALRMCVYVYVCVLHENQVNCSGLVWKKKTPSWHDSKFLVKLKALSESHVPALQCLILY